MSAGINSYIAGSQIRERGHGEHGARVSPPGGVAAVLFVDLAVARRGDFQGELQCFTEMVAASQLRGERVCVLFKEAANIWMLLSCVLWKVEVGRELIKECSLSTRRRDNDSYNIQANNGKDDTYPGRTWQMQGRDP